MGNVTEIPRNPRMKKVIRHDSFHTSVSLPKQGGDAESKQRFLFSSVRFVWLKSQEKDEWKTVKFTGKYNNVLKRSMISGGTWFLQLIKTHNSLSTCKKCFTLSRDGFFYPVFPDNGIIYYVYDRLAWLRLHRCAQKARSVSKKSPDQGAFSTAWTLLY